MSDGNPHDCPRAVSKALFGSRYRLETACAIARGGDVLFAREIAQALTIGDNQAQLELRHFADGGILEKLARVPGQRQQYYRRLPSPFWELALALNEDLLQRAVPDAERP